MLPAFIIGLREGVEAALIVGIVAAFLRQRGRADALRWVALGVGAAAVVCLAVGIALRTAEEALPHRAQETLESVVALVAVAMITYMIVWMRQHGASIKASLEREAGSALAEGSVAALVAMSFVAVLREGFETAVFLVAAFQGSLNSAATGSGAAAGLVVASGLGYAIYRGGVRINLARFFGLTALVLVVVSAGLLTSAVHTAHEAGFLNFWQAPALDLHWLVRPGPVASSLVTGMFGVQPRPTVLEVVAWLIYLVPVGLYVVLPQRRQVAASRRTPGSPPWTP
jgi:high-affinity iron transporter